MTFKPTFNIQQAVEYLNCSRSHVYRLYDSGEIEGFKLGNRQGIRFFRDSCEAWIKKRIDEAGD